MQAAIAVYYERPLPLEKRGLEDRLTRLRTVPLRLHTLRQQPPERAGEIDMLEAQETERRGLVVGLGEVGILRLTFHQASYLDRGHYFQLWEQGGEWFKELFGVEMGDRQEMEPYMGNLRNLVHYRAEILASLPRSMDGGVPRYMADLARVPYAKLHPDLATLEGDPAWPEASTAPVPPLEDVLEGVTWEPVALPGEWTGMQEMADHFPPDLLDACVEAARRLNVRILPSVPDFLSPVRRRLIVKETG